MKCYIAVFNMRINTILNCVCDGVIVDRMNVVGYGESSVASLISSLESNKNYEYARKVREFSRKCIDGELSRKEFVEVHPGLDIGVVDRAVSGCRRIKCGDYVVADCGNYALIVLSREIISGEKRRVYDIVKLYKTSDPMKTLIQACRLIDVLVMYNNYEGVKEAIKCLSDMGEWGKRIYRISSILSSII